MRGKEKGRIRSRIQFPSSIRVRIPSDDDRACRSYADEVCFYEANFVNGLRFLIHPFLRELFIHLSLAPFQLVPNLWRVVICNIAVWMSMDDKDTIGYWEFKPWDRSSSLILESSSSLRNWKTNFFFISGEGWEAIPGKDPREAPKLLHNWGTLMSGVSFIHSRVCVFQCS